VTEDLVDQHSPLRVVISPFPPQILDAKIWRREEEEREGEIEEEMEVK
jgi:hypothetical protein